jgi:hypothetical protein
MSLGWTKYQINKCNNINIFRIKSNGISPFCKLKFKKRFEVKLSVTFFALPAFAVTDLFMTLKS